MAGIPWSPNEIQFLKENCSNMSSRELALALNRTVSSIQGKVNKLGLSIGYRYHSEQTIEIVRTYYPLGGYTEVQKYVNLSKEQIQEIAKRYNIKSTWRNVDSSVRDFIKANRFKLSPLELSTCLNLPILQIESLLSEYESLDKRANKVSENSISRLGLRTDFFSKWSVEMAWVLGFIATDGCINEGNRLNVTVHKKDKDVIDKIASHLGTNIETKFSVARDQFYLDVCNENIISDLEKLRITPKKSLTLEPSNVPNEFISHYIRGLIDGDGSVLMKSNGRSYRPAVMFCGTKSMAEYVAHFMNLYKVKPIKIYERTERTGTKLYCIGINGKYAINFCSNFLYKDSRNDIRLARKYNNYLSFLT